MRKHDGLIDTVQEFWSEALLEFFVDLALHAIVVSGTVTLERKTHHATSNVAGAEVRGHDDDGVLEVNNAALTVG